MQFNIKRVCLEGVDGSGKTTLFRSIHKLTGHRYNIHDRSTLSMLCYAIMYDRDVEYWRSMFYEEITDLNNVIIALMPDISVIQARLITRGDEVQDNISIVKLHEIFTREVANIQNFPNVFVSWKPIANCDNIVSWLQQYEDKSYDNLAQISINAVNTQLNSEINFLKMSWIDDKFDSLCIDNILYESELEYYESTLNKLRKKIRDELIGQNEYKVQQTSQSRRFIMTQDSCISYAHFIYRDNILHSNIVCRSSNVVDILPCDIHFIAEMGKTARHEIGLPATTPVRFYLTLDSAHVI